eukprot:362671-Chlamydomonas_euryale.AAC.9
MDGDEAGWVGMTLGGWDGHAGRKCVGWALTLAGNMPIWWRRQWYEVVWMERGHWFEVVWMAQGYGDSGRNTSRKRDDWSGCGSRHLMESEGPEAAGGLQGKRGMLCMSVWLCRDFAGVAMRAQNMCGSLFVVAVAAQASVEVIRGEVWLWRGGRTAGSEDALGDGPEQLVTRLSHVCPTFHTSACRSCRDAHTSGGMDSTLHALLDGSDARDREGSRSCSQSCSRLHERLGLHAIIRDIASGHER